MARTGGSASSLIPDTLKGMDDPEFKRVQDALREKGQRAITADEQRRTQRSLDRLGLPAFAGKVREMKVSPLVRGLTTVFQLNIGLFCNQACTHCHVESSPKRTEVMSQEVADRCLRLLDASPSVSTVDLTGGAPELCPAFRGLVAGARERNVEVIDRCNLTVLMEPGQEDLADFLAQHRVRVVASLPCYSMKNVDSQRGAGVFERSIAGLRKLNALGYGMEGSGLELDLVYNPGGAFLAPSQATLEPAYKEELLGNFGVRFNRLLCLNNMPIKRFHDWLQRRGSLEEYMALLVQSFNAGAAEGVMCRNTVSVNWDGRLFDCDFNQQLDIPLVIRGRDETLRGCL